MTPSDEALAALARGECVAVQAVPGAGKTHVLLQACDAAGGPGGPAPRCLILAYNTQLAAAVNASLEARALSDRVTCLTFHALCGRCLAPARDDAQLEAALDAAAAGALVPRDVPAVDRVLIDEAQDVRALYVRLLTALGLVAAPTALLVAGDANQLLYDFDPAYEATLDTLQAPERTFGRPFAHVTLQCSRRLTAPVVAFVNAAFGTSIVAAPRAADAPPPPPIEVRAPKTAFQMLDVLRDVLVGDAAAVGDTLLLVDRRRGNRPLLALLNGLSREGRTRLHVHGVDGDDAWDGGKLRCSTWWGAKGLECDTAVVLLPATAPRNPTFVALTRARRRLVVVLDPRAPHAAASRALLQLPPECVDVQGVRAGSALAAGAQRLAADSLAPREDFVPREGAMRCADRWAPRRAAVVAHTAVDVVTPPSADAADSLASSGVPVRMPTGAPEDAREAALRLALVLAEHRATGSVRAMEDVLHPTRLDAEQGDAALRAGFAGRAVPRSVPDAALLAPDLRRAAQAAYCRMHDRGEGGDGDGGDRHAAAAEVALATLAWDGFDHVMRQLRPVRAWVGHPQVARAVACVDEHLPAHAAYDLRLIRGDAHVRVHASDARACYHVAWGLAASDDAEAAVRAAMHPAKKCVLVDAATGEVREVRVDDAGAVLAAC
jgi:hypothetical protein